MASFLRIRSNNMTDNATLVGFSMGGAIVSYRLCLCIRIEIFIVIDSSQKEFMHIERLRSTGLEWFSI